MNRRWTVLLPVIFVSYSLSYLDRANFSFGAAAGMASDLHISGAQNSLLGSLFFLGYFLFQIPGAINAQKCCTWKPSCVHILIALSTTC